MEYRATSYQSWELMLLFSSCFQKWRRIYLNINEKIKLFNRFSVWLWRGRSVSTASWKGERPQRCDSGLYAVRSVWLLGLSLCTPDAEIHRAKIRISIIYGFVFSTGTRKNWSSSNLSVLLKALLGFLPLNLKWKPWRILIEKLPNSI